MINDQTHERYPQGDPAPCSAEEALRRLESGLSEEIAAVESTDPGPVASFDALLAHGLRANRLHADGKYIDEVRARLEDLKRDPETPHTEEC